MATDDSSYVSMSYPAIRPPVNLSIGLYNVLYSAIDSSGNQANCTFLVQVASKSSYCWSVMKELLTKMILINSSHEIPTFKQKKKIVNCLFHLTGFV